MTSSSFFGYKGSNEEGDDRWGRSCKGRQELCGLVANLGSRHIGSGCSSLGSVLCGSKRSRMILQRWRSGEGGGRVLGEKKIHLGNGRCLQNQFLVHR